MRIFDLKKLDDLVQELKLLNENLNSLIRMIAPLLGWKVEEDDDEYTEI